MASLADINRTFSIEPASFPEDLETVRFLFLAYTTWMSIDLSFQEYDKELAGLPGKYAAPAGRMLLARSDTSAQALGCVALRRLEDLEPRGRCCEMKRLYVLPEGRHKGIGKALATCIIQKARLAEYHFMVLDTFDWMTSAITLYESLGFETCEAYYKNSEKGLCYFRLDLRGSRST